MTIVNSLSECVIPEDKVWPLYPDSICTKDKFKPLIQICSPRRYSMKLLVGRLFSMQVEPSVYTCSDVFLKIPQRVATDYTQAIALLVSSSCLQSPLVWTRTFLLDPLKSVSATHSLSLLTSFFCPASLMALKISARTFVCPIPTAAVPASLLAHSFPLTPADTGTNMKLFFFFSIERFTDFNSCLWTPHLSIYLSLFIESMRIQTSGKCLRFRPSHGSGYCHALLYDRQAE